MGKAGYQPEIFALGIRNAIGLFVHPETGEIWETENGPMGGDEINIIRPGKNYGWPVVSYGMDYSGNQEGGLSGTSIERPHEGGDGGAVLVLESLPRCHRHHHLHGRQVSRVEGQYLRRRDGRRAISGPVSCTGLC